MSNAKSSTGGTSRKERGIINNMPPQKPHANQSPAVNEPLFWCGCDWLKLNFQVEFLEWERLHDLLNLFSAAAVQGGKEIKTSDLGGAIMMPGGASIGKGTGKRGKFCKYRLRLPFGVMVIAESKKYSGTWPNVQVNMSGEICLTYPSGVDQAYEDCIQWLESLSVQIDSEKVSRVDFCADFPDWEMEHFVSAFVEKKWRCRAKRKAMDESNGTSLYFGCAPLMLRIYDKLAEIEQGDEPWKPMKYRHMIEKRWHGEKPECAVRIEYQVSRDKLREWGIDSFADLKAKGGMILGYLTGARDEPMWDSENKEMRVLRWFRFLEKKKNVKHPEYDVPSPLWKIAQRTFMERFGKPEPLIKVEPEGADVGALIKQMLGVGKAAAWHKGFSVPGKEDSHHTNKRFKTFEDFQEWKALLERKAAIESGGWKFRHIKPGQPT